MSKPIIYQLLPRLFTNTTDANVVNGTIEQNGCGKLNQINDAALDYISSLGATYVWYTGIIRHASTTNYPYFSHPANANVVKGKAGSPYAICDYYDVDPDLAENVDARMDEWRALVERTHKHGLKVIIDYVPNHVARNYFSDTRTDVDNLGQNDDVSVPFSPQNNFYYIGNESFTSPVTNLDVPYIEKPAKASGNDAFTSSPSVTDWYETVKLNYGVDFRDSSKHFDPKPDTWLKIRDILLFWVKTGVDAFRVDMAEMVPLEFWRWIIAQVVARHPKIKFIAETYKPETYEDYVASGFNFLYDKVVFYDTLRAVASSKAPASNISNVWRTTHKVGSKMLYFLENHDEQRIASDFFLKDPLRARPAYVAALTMGMGAAMLYSGQELGERGMEQEGFSGVDGKTTIFDYWSVGSLSRNAKSRYDGSLLLEEEKNLVNWYREMGGIIKKYQAFSLGGFYDLMWVNQHISVDAVNVYAFLRYHENERFLVALNFATTPRRQMLRIPEDAWRLMGCTWNECIQPSYILGHAQFVSRASVNNIKEQGLLVEIPAHDAIILKF